MATLPTHAEFFSHGLQPTGDGEACPRCADTPSDESVLISSCAHIVCRHCLRVWCETENTCPTCQVELFTAATTPLARVTQIPEGFYDQLQIDVVDPDRVRRELEKYAEGMTNPGDDVSLSFDMEVHLMPNHNAIQAFLIGAGIWNWNKVDLDYDHDAPDTRALIKTYWVKVIRSLDGKLAELHSQEWQGKAVDFFEALTSAVDPLGEELRQNNVRYRDHDHRWMSDGFTEHERRIEALAKFVVRCQWDLDDMVTTEQEGLIEMD